MSLHDDFYKLMNEYAQVFDLVSSTKNYKHPFGSFIRKEIAASVKKLDSITDDYKVKASCGAGIWTSVPWIAVFDKRITTSAQKGVYIVYLLNKDEKELYLTLNQGATDVSQDGPDNEGKLVFTGIAASSNAHTTEKLRQKAKHIREIINPDASLTSQTIITGSAAYDAGCICAIKYNLSDLPDEKQLFSDLDAFLGLYKAYYDMIYNIKADPQVHETGAFDSWEIVNETVAIKTCDKSFFDYNGSGVPRKICWFFSAESLNLGETQPITISFHGADYTGKVTNETSDRHRVRVFWSTELGQAFKQIPNRDNLKIKFTKTSDNAYTAEEIEESARGEIEVPVSEKEIIGNIKTYIAARGFSYNEGLIENFYLSLKSKPFVILAGTSGTGKTRLVKLFAEAVGANTDNGRYKMVAVRPDWSDSSDLFGHVDLNGKFVPGAIIDFVKRAELDIAHPYFLCLDEMNLARVEYYLSDILSVIETRDYVNGRIVSDPLVSGSYYGSDSAAAGRYGTVLFPENLYIIGTVNMDETTFPFSKKVLDRANTIEFSYVDLLPTFEPLELTSTISEISNGFLKTDYLLLAQCADQQDKVIKYCTELQNLNIILQQASAHVGYRVRDEIVFYLLNNSSTDLIPDEVAMDNAIMQKILPRIQGSSASVKKMLCDLFKLCAGDFEGYQTEAGDISAKMLKVAQKPDCKYKKSANKIAFMVRRYEEDGFTSYWL